MNKEWLENIKHYPNSGGKTALTKYYEGKQLPASQAILANCCMCMGGFIDGREDCDMPECSLYPWMPYGKGKDTREKRKGTPPTEEQKKRMQEGRRKVK